MVMANQQSKEDGLEATENNSKMTKTKEKLSSQVQSRRDVRGVQCKSFNFAWGDGETPGISALSEYKKLTSSISWN